MPLFVVLRDGVALDDDLVARIRERIREDCSPRHVPDEIRADRRGAAHPLGQGARGSREADPERRAGRHRAEPRLARQPRRAPSLRGARRNPRVEERMTYVADRRPLRADAVPPHRSQRPEAAGRLARPLEQLRRRPPARDEPRDRPSCVRPRDHALRPREQLRPALRLGRGDVRPAARERPAPRTGTRSSSRRRPATTCGPARTASGARGSTSSRASTRASADGARLRRHLLLAPSRSRDAARGDDGRARRGRPPGQGALRRDLVLLRPTRRARRPRSSSGSGRRSSSTSRRTRCSTAGSRTGSSTSSASSGSAASASRRSRRGC